MVDALLETKADITTLLGGVLGRWQILNLSTPTQAIAITPDPITGEVYPPPGTELLEGVEAIIRLKGISAPTIDRKVAIAVEVVIACPLSLSTALLAALQIVQGSGRYLISGLSPANNGQSQVFKLTRFFEA